MVPGALPPSINGDGFGIGWYPDAYEPSATPETNEMNLELFSIVPPSPSLSQAQEELFPDVNDAINDNLPASNSVNSSNSGGGGDISLYTSISYAGHEGTFRSIESGGDTPGDPSHVSAFTEHRFGIKRSKTVDVPFTLVDTEESDKRRETPGIFTSVTPGKSILL
jgi:hypothetical protein